MANCSRTTHPTGPQCHHPSIPLPISPPPTPKNLCPFRKLIPPSPRLYRQDHSRGRGLTTTGQPTVSTLPQNFNSLFPCKIKGLRSLAQLVSELLLREVAAGFERLGQILGQIIENLT